MRGLGDLVAVITKYTGIRWVVDKVFAALGRDCGCSARQERWNRSVPFKKEDEDPIIRELLDSEDMCIICTRITSVAKDTPVEDRSNYVEGTGQLCNSCYKRIVG